MNKLLDIHPILCDLSRVPVVLSAAAWYHAETMPTNDKFGAAIEALQLELQEQMQAVAETKKMINALRKRVRLAPLYSDVSAEQAHGIMRPDQYYGKALATAVQEYLEHRKQACKAEEILRGLTEGGFDFSRTGWREDDRLRSLSISLAKNTKTFHRLPNGTFGLLSWYDLSHKEAESEQ